MLLIVVLIAVCIFGPFICKMEEKSKQETAQAKEKARQEAAAQAAAERKQFAAVLAEEKAAAAAIRKAEQQRKKAEREEERKRKQAEKLEAARQLAEYQERALQAEKELRTIRAEKPTKTPAAAPAVSLETFAARVNADKKPDDNAPKTFDAPQSFVNERVAFTGTLPTMTRAEAIAATKQRGGRGYQKINTDCTLLVIGQRPGRQQQERAEQWNIPTITWEEWFKRAEISWRRRQYMQALAAEKAAC